MLKGKIMDLQYSTTIYFAVTALIALGMMVRGNALLDRDKKTEFTGIIQIIIVAAISEWLGVFLDGGPIQFRDLHIIARVVEHSFVPVIIVFFVGVISEEAETIDERGCKDKGLDGGNAERKITERTMRGYRKWLATLTKMQIVLLRLLIIHAILECISGFTGFIFYVDEANFYHHGGWYWIYVVFYVGCGLYYILEISRFSKRYQMENRWVMLMMILLFVTGMGFSLLNSRLHCAYISLALLSLFFYMYYTGVIEARDGLTGLLNRRSYESRIGSARKPMMVLFFDVDDFKTINDQYGHQFGDKCLKCIGDILWDVYGTAEVNGACYRIGGDEFCVLLPCRARLTDEVMESLNGRFIRKIEKKREKEPLLPMVSVGYGAYEPGINDMESAIKEADEYMYKWKQKRKEGRKEKSR